MCKSNIWGITHAVIQPNHWYINKVSTVIESRPGCGKASPKWSSWEDISVTVCSNFLVEVGPCIYPTKEVSHLPKGIELVIKPLPKFAE